MSFKNYLIDATQKLNNIAKEFNDVTNECAESNNKKNNTSDTQIDEPNCCADKNIAKPDNTDKNQNNTDKTAVPGTITDKEGLEKQENTMEIPQILNVLRHKMFKAGHDLEESYASKLKAAIDLLQEGY